MDYEKCKYFTRDDITPWHGDVYDHPSYKNYCIKNDKKKILISPETQCPRCQKKKKKI